jgi:nitrite reductase/ring-hydroxylating ferredoxin subunit
MDDLPTTSFVRVGDLEELKARGRLVVRGPHRPILVVYDHGRIFALDNRCPHMGFPLERGSVEDGILTCHWHHARFDLASGCTFDLWTDDVPSCSVEVRGSEIWVQPTFGHADPATHWRRRLDDGLAHDLGLVIAKAVYGELAADVPPANVVGQIALYGARNRDGWGVRVFADAGHSLDFINKAFECLDLIGWEHAAAVLPTVVGQMIAARGAEESTAWRQPADLVALCQTVAAELPRLIAESRGRGRWSDHAALAHALLGDEPVEIMDAVESAVRAGATPPDLGRSLAYAAALRVAHFGSANEHADWETAHHVFTYANAIHGMLARTATAEETGHAEAVRGVLHGAMALYLARYLNVPPARIPGDGDDRLADLPSDAEGLCAALLDAFDRQRQVDFAARLVARYLTLGHPPQALIATLARALLREDASFHGYQMLEAGVRQFGTWGGGEQGRHILIAVARYLAAHSPTERAALQTAEIARRLMRGGDLHQDVGAS